MATRKDVRQKLHAAHQGINGTKRRERQTVYWPGINNDIQSDCESCIPCQRAAASLPQEPMISDPQPCRIFEEVSADLFSHGVHHFLAYTDRLSSWTTVTVWGKDPTSHDLTKTNAQEFVYLSVPVKVRSDGETKFDSREFRSFFTVLGRIICAFHSALPTEQRPR